MSAALARPVPGWLADGDTRDWVRGQTSAALRDGLAVEIAEVLLREAGLPLHPDRPKSWDTFLAVYHALDLGAIAAPVLDAGAERYSMLLPALRRLGAEDLTGINLVFGAPERIGGIVYRHGDVTASGLPSGRFGFVACLSVIEHGVDPAAFFREAARLLRPGGHAFVSFDYWEDGVDTGGQRAYGVPIRIFTRADVAHMQTDAAAAGLVTEGVGDFRCDERVAHWHRFGLRYTFANLLLRKAG
jgi:SAM-dependent methyltransferase